MNPSIELSLIVRRYLRRCHRDGDIEPLTAAGLLPSDRDLLFETAYWRGCDHLKPGIIAEVAIDWNTLWSQKLEETARPPEIRHSPTADFYTDLFDYYRTCARNLQRLEDLGAAGADSVTIELFLLAPAAPAFSGTDDSAVNVHLHIDRQRVKHIQKFCDRNASELSQHVRLVAGGATYDLMKQLTGCSTHEFAALRKITAIDHPRGRMPKPSPAKLRQIRELINLVCPNGNPLGIAEYLRICDHIDDRDDLVLGEIHAAQLRVISPDQPSEQDI